MSTDTTFLDLVRRACDRDEAAAAELVRRFEPELCRVIRFLLTDPGLRRLRRLLDSLDVPTTGRATLTFPNIRLPRRAGQKEVVFSPLSSGLSSRSSRTVYSPLPMALPSWIVTSSQQGKGVSATPACENSCQRRSTASHRASRWAVLASACLWSDPR